MLPQKFAETLETARPASKTTTNPKTISFFIFSFHLHIYLTTSIIRSNEILSTPVSNLQGFPLRQSVATLCRKILTSKLYEFIKLVCYRKLLTGLAPNTLLVFQAPHVFLFFPMILPQSV
jgi:hypothetical protein